MNKEIKEILDRLDFNEWEVDLYKVPITWCELYDIRDYITNLQKTQEALIKNDNEIITNLQEQYEKADNDRHKLFEQKEKANWWLKEMLKQAKSDETKAIINGTLELLLNGGDDNER